MLDARNMTVPQGLSPERAARYAAVLPVCREADRIESELSYASIYHDYDRANQARRAGFRALYLLCRPTSRKRFNRKLRAYRQELAHLAKYVPTGDEDYHG